VVGAGAGELRSIGGPAASVNNATVDLQLAAMSVSNTSTTGVSLTNMLDGGGTNAAFSAPSGSTITTTGGATGPIFNVSGGDAAISYAGTLTNSGTGRAVSVVSHAGNDAITFSGAITASTGTGILLDNNDQGGGNTPITFSGGITLSGASSTFTATNGGTVNVTGTNTIGTPTAATTTALNVANTNIGGSNVTFRSISANGATNGILLNNTGAGRLIVTGNSSGSCGGTVTVNAVGTPATVGAPVTADCTGGTIQASGGAGVSLTNTTGTSLTRMHILNSGSDGIFVSDVNGFTLANSFVTDGSGAAGDRGIEMGDFSTGTPVDGTITISNSTLGPTPHDNFGVGIASGTSNWSITNTVFDDSQLNSGFNFEIRNATMTSFLIDGSVFQNQFADGMQMQPASGVDATVTSATIQNSTFQSNNIGMDLNHDGTGDITYRVLNNTFMNQVANSINFFSSAVQAPATGGTLNGRFVGNVIGNAAVFNSGGGIGIRININGGADATVLVDSNTIRQIPNGRGIEIISRNGTGGTDATVTNNQVNTDFVPTVANGGFSLSNIFLQSNCVTVCNTLRSDVRLNTVPAVAPTGELIAFQLALFETGASTLELVDTPPASGTCSAQLTSTNTGSAGANAGCSLIAGPINTPP
jgi:hypothetical protein